jgi:perosamine synthetase
LFRYDAKTFGIGREKFLEALLAEGITSAAPGYVLPLYRQPMFTEKAFGPYDAASRVDYKSVRLPVCEQLSSTEGAWLYQSVLLAEQSDMDDIVDAFTKIYEQRESLSASKEAVGAVR